MNNTYIVSLWNSFNICYIISVINVNIHLWKKIILLLYLNLNLLNCKKLKYLNIRNKVIYIINKIQEDLYLLYITSDQMTKSVICSSLHYYTIVVGLLGPISIISLLYYLIDKDLEVTLLNLVIFYYMQIKMHTKKIIKSKLFNELCLILDRCHTIDDIGKAFFNIIKNTNIVLYLIQYIVLLFIVYLFSPLLCIYLIQLTISILGLFLGTMLLIYTQTNKYIKNNFFFKCILSTIAILMILCSFILMINTSKKIDNLFKVYMNSNNPNSNSNPDPNTGNNGSSNPNPNGSEDSLIASNTIENENRGRENPKRPKKKKSTKYPTRRSQILAGEKPDNLDKVNARRVRYDRRYAKNPVLINASDSTQTGEEYKEHLNSFRLEGVRDYKPDSTLGTSGPSKDLTYMNRPGMPSFPLNDQTFENVPVYPQNVPVQNVPVQNVHPQNVPGQPTGYIPRDVSYYGQFPNYIPTNVAEQPTSYIPRDESYYGKFPNYISRNVPEQPTNYIPRNEQVYEQPTSYIPRNDVPYVNNTTLGYPIRNRIGFNPTLGESSQSYSTTGQINQLHMENGNPFRNNNYSSNPSLNSNPTMEQGNYSNTTPVTNTTSTTRNSAFDFSNILNNTNSETSNTTRNSAFDFSNILNTPKLGEKRKRGLETEELGRLSIQNLTSSKKIKK